MSNDRRRAERIRAGTCVKVCVDHQTDLLIDMGLIGKDDSPISDVWMYGNVRTVTKNHYDVDLPAAETDIFFIKEKVLRVDSGYECPAMYVLFGASIKHVKGIQLTGEFLPQDYFTSLEAAQAAAPATAPVDGAVTSTAPAPQPSPQTLTV